MAKMTNASVLDVTEALVALVDKGWEDPLVALQLGKMFRTFRTAADDIDLARRALLKAHAKKNTEGQVLQEMMGQVQLADPLAFSDAWKRLLAAEVELPIHPLTLGRLQAAVEEKNGKRVLNISARAIEVLVFTGIVTIEDPQA